MNKNSPALKHAKERLEAYMRNKRVRASEPDWLGLDIPARDDATGIDALLVGLDLEPPTGEPDDGLNDILDDDVRLELGAPAPAEKFTLADLWDWDEARRKKAKADYDRKRNEAKVLKATGKLPRKNKKLSHLTPDQKAARKKQQQLAAAARQYERKKQKRAEQKLNGAS
ncbi:hypothetical protein [Sinorhizobium meliloti]|uniref:hypothetical protein n=1 Tax=Rhizobium meliloti TaxID=382 RepID=UPI000B4A0FF3|nr:hypothetical protein [Sinorhizobium meliloti]ASP68309.1 hypothetical protein CDO29_28065 [Sinorhizobium meliloti]MQX00656.1 hypothetical protein [Sinorhizobium meliloti]RVK54281.1 hypothetical protein CN160_04600 [Sinorhizobium meliloti]